MLSFKQLSEKKTKIKLNLKEDEVMEVITRRVVRSRKKTVPSAKEKDVNIVMTKVITLKQKKDDSYLETDFKKRQKNNEKSSQGPYERSPNEKPHFESTEDAYVSQEEVSEESTEEIAETETFLSFGQYQHALTLDEEQLNEFLKGLFGGGGSKPASSSSGQMPSHAGLASKLGQRRQMMNKMMGKPDTKVLGFSKGGEVKGKKYKKEETELQEKELSVDDSDENLS